MTRLLLLTNDDGYTSPGLQALWQALDTSFETLVIAPKRQRSWISKAITNPGPLRLHTQTVNSKSVFVLDDGMPADCTNIGLFHLCPRRPDMVVSGINIGPNFTSSLTLASGTVGGALEAAMNGVFGLAVGFDLDMEIYQKLEAGQAQESLDLFMPAARIVSAFVEYLLANPCPPEVKLINLIIPQHLAEPLRILACHPQPYDYGSIFIRKGDEFTNRSVGFLEDQAQIEAMSDVWAVRQGWVAAVAYGRSLETVNIDTNHFGEIKL